MNGKKLPPSKFFEMEFKGMSEFVRRVRVGYNSIGNRVLLYLYANESNRAVMTVEEARKVAIALNEYADKVEDDITAGRCKPTFENF